VLAARLARTLRMQVAHDARRLPDGTTFLPTRLVDREGPYTTVTESRAGSYWNLVVPYALASGLFAPGSREATGMLRYVLGHGGRLLGLVRADAARLYGRGPGSGTDQVYGVNMSRFLADEDEPDQLVLSLYGALAAAMTPNTYVSGESATVAPLHGSYYRAMYLPPNGGANAAFLETLRLMLVHETRTAGGAPAGLELAFATPRGWLEPGKAIRVAGEPTSFGRLSYSLERTERSVRVTVDAPASPRPGSLRLRLRLPARERIGAIRPAGRVRLDRATGTLDLSRLRGRIQLEVAVRRG
jgi:hypothetical protein